ncbi:hypothetical protein [Pedobacter panaciterrae]|jgi:hypothetical protein|uniref:hypothetical protein n=1 Tax=Pedobacter panaciterrae TaxID=363849 RepID=UPI00155D925B|nr:hypothetical protein [Pedobacter panaciterrae]NQX56340.1 hypothetical protein [Pedobacter panaciterrae]
MFLNILALAFLILALIAAFKMDTPVQGVLFMVAIAAVCGLLYLFILFPGFSGLAVAVMLAAFIFRQNKR